MKCLFIYGSNKEELKSYKVSLKMSYKSSRENSYISKDERNVGAERVHG